MRLTDLQKKIVDDILNNRVKNIIDFFKKYCDYREKGSFEYLNKINEAYLSTDISNNHAKCQEFVILVKKLESNGLISLIPEPASKSFLIFSSEDEPKRPAQIDQKILNIFGDHVRQYDKGYAISKEIMALPDLADFINRDYLTVEEFHQTESIKHSKKYQNLSLIFSIIAIAISIITNTLTFIRSEEITYLENGMNFRPRLEIVNDPTIEGIILITDSIKYKHPYIDAFSSIGFAVKIAFRNKGNANTKIITCIQFDTLSGYDNIREIILS